MMNAWLCALCLVVTLAGCSVLEAYDRKGVTCGLLCFLSVALHAVCWVTHRPA